MIDPQSKILQEHFLRQREAAEFHGGVYSFLAETGKTNPKITREGYDTYFPVNFIQGNQKDHIGTVTGIGPPIRTKHKNIRAVRVRRT